MILKPSKSIIITGAPGTGKTTIQNGILRMNPSYTKGLDYTTRKQRKEEIHAIDRYFITTDEFLDLLKGGFFVEDNEESASYNGDFYGTPLTIISESLPTVSVISALSTAFILKQRFPKTIWIHLFTVIDEIVKRLRIRGEKDDSINYRIQPINSDPGTFVENGRSDLNLDTTKLSPNELILIIEDFINSKEQ